MIFARSPRLKLGAWIKNWLEDHYPNTPKLPFDQVRAEMWDDLPHRLVPRDVARQWFWQRARGHVRAAGWALTTDGTAKQLEFIFDMPLGDVLAYEIGKARRAKADLDAIRLDLVRYQEETGQAFDIDRTMFYITRAAGI